jgi:hypothetical protein
MARETMLSSAFSLATYHAIGPLMEASSALTPAMRMAVRFLKGFTGKIRSE